MTEYGDLQCPVCKEFAVGPETQLIDNEVKSGKVKLVYKSFPTASRELGNWQQIFPLQQDAAYAAGAQNKAWNYILLFYHEQGKEATSYVNTAYLTGLAKQVHGTEHEDVGAPTASTRSTRARSTTRSRRRPR